MYVKGIPVFWFTAVALDAAALVKEVQSKTTRFSHRGTAARGPTRLRPSGSWWRRGSCVNSPTKPSTPRGWTTSCSCLCPWTRPPTRVRGDCNTRRTDLMIKRKNVGLLRISDSTDPFDSFTFHHNQGRAVCHHLYCGIIQCCALAAAS